MTRKKFRNMCVAMCAKLAALQGQTISGATLAFYRDKSLRNMRGFKSYAEAWEGLKVARDLVGM